MLLRKKEIKKKKTSNNIEKINRKNQLNYEQENRYTQLVMIHIKKKGGITKDPSVSRMRYKRQSEFTVI